VLDLSLAELGDGDGDKGRPGALAEAIGRLTALTTLDLGGAALGPEGGAAILHVLARGEGGGMKKRHGGGGGDA
jgi:hypothetical protein